MNKEELREYCLSKKGVTEEFPFDDVTLVFKVLGKMFLLTGLDETDFSINIKCDPEKAIDLREIHSCVHPGFHMNKTHWNTVFIDGSISDTMIQKWIDDSYFLVANKLSKTKKRELGIL